MRRVALGDLSALIHALASDQNASVRIERLGVLGPLVVRDDRPSNPAYEGDYPRITVRSLQLISALAEEMEPKLMMGTYRRNHILRAVRAHLATPLGNPIDVYAHGNLVTTVWP